MVGAVEAFGLFTPQGQTNSAQALGSRVVHESNLKFMAGLSVTLLNTYKILPTMLKIPKVPKQKYDFQFVHSRTSSITPEVLAIGYLSFGEVFP